MLADGGVYFRLVEGATGVSEYTGGAKSIFWLAFEETI
jgi:hypothetical protein